MLYFNNVIIITVMANLSIVNLTSELLSRHRLFHVGHQK